MERQQTDTNIFLIGFMGAGKSTVSGALKRDLAMQKIEMDALIEEQEGISISRIFAEKGEEYFRKKETAFLLSIRPESGLVVSCGGGVPMRAENVQAMRERGVIVWLTARPETILKRVGRSHARPLLEGHKNIEYIRKMMDEREPFYSRAADLIVSTDDKTAAQIGREIKDHLTHQG